MNDELWRDFALLLGLTLGCIVLMQLSGVGSVALMAGLLAACAAIGVLIALREWRGWLGWE
jgi:hypothetical protein